MRTRADAETKKTVDLCTQNAGRNGHSYTALTCHHICCANKRRNSIGIKLEERNFFFRNVGCIQSMDVGLGVTAR